MRPVGLLQHAISLTWILSILAGCAIPPERSTASPSATATDAQPTTSSTPEPAIETDEVICMCVALMDIEAYVDINANGNREAWEDPLQGARFRVEMRSPKKSPTSQKEVFYVESDATGQAQYDVSACCFPGPDPDPGTVYAEVPPDYKITTSDRCRPPADCIFGFAPLHVAPIGVREADLRGADLNGTDLRGEDLRDADLTGADLREADLRGAKLSSAELSGAALQGADLSEADLRETNVRSAQMSRAVLVEANLIGADLSSADLSGADMSQAHLLEADLHGAKYDRYTQWPESFDPVAAGAVLGE